MSRRPKSARSGLLPIEFVRFMVWVDRILAAAEPDFATEGGLRAVSP